MRRPALLCILGLAAAACGAFGSSESPQPADEGKDAAAIGDASSDAHDDAPGDDDASHEGDASPEASTCGTSRAPGLYCGAGTCMPGQTCCIDVPRSCAPINSGCPNAQWDCQGSADCSGGKVCCQAALNIGSRCVLATDCQRERYCHSSA